MTSRYNYRRRRSSEAVAGGVGIGGANPIRLQSMTNTSTLDTEGSAAQVRRIAEAGGEIVRLTTQGEREANNMAPIRKALRDSGCEVPLVADVHFNPKAAFAAARVTDKVRINPGNFVDPGRTFVKLEFTDEEYGAEIERIRRTLVPFLDICREHGTCVRLGVNHGSLSDRIMSRYGDTPEGMVESVMEYLRICGEENFHNVVISIKASNTTVMVRTVRLLVEEMEKAGMAYPLHLGVTEAGDGEDGRIKSAAGIGALLAEGLGDTIRVSLSEDPEREIPVARRLRDYIVRREGHAPVVEPETVLPGLAREYALLPEGFGTYPVLGLDLPTDSEGWHRADASEAPKDFGDNLPVILTSSHINAPGEMMSWIDRFVAEGHRNPVVLELAYEDVDDFEDLQVRAAADFGALFLSGYGSGISLRARHFDLETLDRLALGILQATRLRMTKTEYIACPGCGRTLFDLHTTLAEVRKATSHLKGLKIGVMGCIVNGPGEMADADYGYVGAGPGRVSIYRGKELIRKNIPTAEALPALLALIGNGEPGVENGEWRMKSGEWRIENGEWRMGKLIVIVLMLVQACVAFAQHCCMPDSVVREMRFPLTEQDTQTPFYYFNDEWIGGATLDMVPVDSIRKIEVKDDEYGNRAVFLTVSPEIVEDIRAQLRNRWLNFDPICEYPGGNGKFKEWIADNLKVPEDFKGSEVVLVRVTILPDGTVTDPKLIKPSKNDAANQEALRLVGLLPKFRIQYCTPRKSPLYYNIPFRFTEPGTIFIRGAGMDN